MKPSRMLLWRITRQARIWGIFLLFGILLRTANVYAAMPGDVCGSNANVVDITDALCTLRYIVGLIPHDTANNAVYLAADVAPLDSVTRLPKGGNGVTISDALGILRYVVKLDSWISATTFVNGTAAAGAPIIGSVTIKDSSSPAATKTVPIAADGKYTVDVTGLKAPYMVRADGYVGGNEYHLYSAGTLADVGGTINITPLTDLIVANIAKSVAGDYFNSGSFTTLTAADLKIESDAMVAKLQPILAAVGVSGSIDLLRASFSTDHTGLDAALDILRVNTTDTSTGAATITNIITQQSVASNTPAVLTDTTGVATAASDIQLISAGFKKFSDLFASSLPSDTNPTLLGLFDSATFMEEGQDLAAFLSKITTGNNMVGISFANISIQSMDTIGNAVVTFDVVQNGKVSNDGPEVFHMIKKNDVWYMQGDQRIAYVDVVPQAEYHVSDSLAQFVTGLRLDIEDRGGKGITSALFSGAGLPADGITLINNIAYNYFEIQGQQYGGNLYSMTDTAIGAVADTGEIYTVKLYIGTTLEATYTEKIKKRPYGNTELSAASFPSFTLQTVADMKAFTGGNATVSWTLPTGLTNDWLNVQIGDNNGNSAMFEAGLLPTDTSKSFTLNPVTSTGQSFAINYGSIWLGTWDSYGRQLATSIYGGGSNPP